MYQKLRRRLVIFFALCVFSAGGLGWYAYLHYTDPETVRRLVLGFAQQFLPGTHVTLDKVEGHFLGGLEFQGLRIEMLEAGNGPPFLAEFGSIYLLPNKDSLLEGKLHLEQVILDKPVLRLHRRADGKWNFSQFLRNKPIRFPSETAIRVMDGTLAISTADGAFEPVQIDDIDFEIGLAPEGMLTLKGSLCPPACKTIALDGHIDFVAEKIYTALSTTEPLVLRNLEEKQPRLKQALEQLVQGLDGQFALRGTVEYFWKKNLPPKFTLEGEVRQVEFDHHLLPFPIRGLHSILQADNDGLRILRLAGKMGESSFDMRGELPNWSPQKANGSGVVRQLPFAPEIYAMLPERHQVSWDRFQPKGSIDGEATFRMTESGPKFTGKAFLRNVSVLFERFPYPVNQIEGTVELTEAGTVKLDGRGMACTRPVRLTGEMANIRPFCGMNLQMTGTNVPYDEYLVNALPPAAQPTMQMMHGKGVGDFKCAITREQGEQKIHFLVESTLRFESFSCDWFQYDLKDLTGELVVDAEKTIFRRCVGKSARTGEASVRIDGQVAKKDNGTLVEVYVEANHVPFDDPLREAMQSKGDAMWAALHPEGHMDLSCTVVKDPERPIDIRCRISPNETTITPTTFPYRLERFRGTVYCAGEAVWWENITAFHGVTELRCRAGKFVSTDTDGYFQLQDLVCDSLPVDIDFLRALPPEIREGVIFLSPDRPVGLQVANYEAKWYSDGRPTEQASEKIVAFNDCSLIPQVGAKHVTGQVKLQVQTIGDSEKVEGNIVLDNIELVGFQATELTARLNAENELLNLENIRGKIYEGQLHGTLRARCDNNPAYDCRVDIFDANLAEYVRLAWQMPPTVNGNVNAHLFLNGEGETIDKLHGNGSIEMRNADLYRLPVLFDLLDFFALRFPNGQLFDKASTVFKLEDREMLIDELELTSPSFSLFMTENQGRVNLDSGDVDLRLGMRWGPGRMVIPVFSETLNTASDQLFTVHLTGQMSNPIFTPGPGSIVRQILDTPRQLLFGKKQLSSPPPKTSKR